MGGVWIKPQAFLISTLDEGEWKFHLAYTLPLLQGNQHYVDWVGGRVEAKPNVLEW
jgi:hypothetical protein